MYTVYNYVVSIVFSQLYRLLTFCYFIRPEWRFDIPRIQKSLQKYLGKGKNGGTESTTDGILGEVNNFNGFAKLIAKANSPTGIPLKRGC